MTLQGVKLADASIYSTLSLSAVQFCILYISLFSIDHMVKCLYAISGV